MANSKIIVYGVSNLGEYIPLSVDTSGFLNVHITDSIPLLVFGLGENDIDGIAPINTGLVQDQNFNFGFNGATWDRTRIANVFKTVVATAAGNTTIWTPAAGKSFRLMGFSLSVSGTAAALTANLLKLTDGNGGTNIAQYFAAVSATVVGDTQVSVNLEQGKLSGAINTPLVLNIATAFTAGGVAVSAWGCEE